MMYFEIMLHEDSELKPEELIDGARFDFVSAEGRNGREKQMFLDAGEGEYISLRVYVNEKCADENK